MPTTPFRFYKSIRRAPGFARNMLRAAKELDYKDVSIEIVPAPDGPVPYSCTLMVRNANHSMVTRLLDAIGARGEKHEPV